MQDITPQQELFCQYYTKNDVLFGNGTLAYAEAYQYLLDSMSDDDAEYELKPDGTKGKLLRKSTRAEAYDTCSASASRLLRSDKIQTRITALLNEILKDEIVDSQLAKLITQNKDNTAKMAAIREYNKLRGRIIEKQDLTTQGDKLNLTYSPEVEAIALEVANKLKEQKLNGSSNQ